MRVLITGGAGFIGSHVVERYLEGGWEVSVLDDLSTGRRANVPNGVELLVGNLAEPGLQALLENVEFDLVNHHAAQIDVRVSVNDPGLDAKINLVGLLNLLEVVRSRGMKPVLFASSGGVLYGEAEVVPTPENAPKLPFSPYGVAKLASEYYLQYYALVHGLRYAALRYGNVYGPRQNPEGEAGVVAIFCRKILDGQPLTVYGSGLQDRDFVYVKDVSEANWLVSQELAASGAEHSELRATAESARGDTSGIGKSARDMGGPGEAAGDAIDGPALNIGTGRPTTVLELARVLGKIVGSELEVRHAAARAGELFHSTLDSSKVALRLAGWRARTPLEEGLDATYRHIAARHGASA